LSLYCHIFFEANVKAYPSLTEPPINVTETQRFQTTNPFRELKELVRDWIPRLPWEGSQLDIDVYFKFLWLFGRFLKVRTAIRFGN